MGGIPKLILLDWELPKVDGLEVLKILQADERTKLIPIYYDDRLKGGYNREL